MTLAAKLQLKPGQSVFVADPPSGMTLELPPEWPRTDDLDDADAALFFAVKRSDLERLRSQLVAVARKDRLVWLGYPKARQLGTDLNRNSLWEPGSVGPTRIASTWSASRFARHAGRAPLRLDRSEFARREGP